MVNTGDAGSIVAPGSGTGISTDKTHTSTTKDGDNNGTASAEPVNTDDKKNTGTGDAAHNNGDGSGDKPAPTVTLEPTPTPTPDVKKDDPKPGTFEAVMQEADIKAKMYDYDAAIELLKACPEYETSEEAKAAVTRYEEDKAKCVKWPDNSKISHIFVHSLIVDTSRAFGPKSSQPLGYNKYMTTVSEFNKMIESMYERGYVLVSIHDIAKRVMDIPCHTTRPTSPSPTAIHTATLRARQPFMRMRIHGMVPCLIPGHRSISHGSRLRS